MSRVQRKEKIEPIETVSEHCKYEGCAYRGVLGHTPCCDYILVEGKPRGCKISECDKHREGKKVRIKNDSFSPAEWEVVDDV